MSRLYTDEQLADIARPFEAYALDALARGDLQRVRELLVEMRNGPAGLDGLSGHTLSRKAGKLRRGYFVEGLGGAQFAYPGTVDRLRRVRDEDAETEVVALAATDPANPYGWLLPWPPLPPLPL